jgi:hypothetical protein
MVDELLLFACEVKIGLTSVPVKDELEASGELD